ncbi:MAG: Omp28-related outer membrane protein, partial [Dysgonamonadaceae bacterium]|nr:Omp28-related outer membrane protein [Dysgonamonadaceae bacterium]
MKRFLLLFLVIFLIGKINADGISQIIAPVSGQESLSPAQITDGTALKIGYCEETTNGFGGFGGNVAGTAQVGIFFPAEYLIPYTGKNITKLVIGIANYSFSNLKIILSETVGGSEIYSQPVSSLSRNRWNEVQLTTPYTISEGKGLFITYQLDYAAQQFPIGLCPGPAHPQGDYFKSNTGWQHIAADLGGDFNIALLAVIEGDGLIQNEIALLSLDLPKFSDLNEFVIKGKIKNNGTQTLNSFELEYQIGNGEPVTQKIENINLPNYATYNFSVNNINVNETGEKSIRVKLKNPNNETDNGIDNELNRITYFYDKSNNTTQRKVLLEHFTTAKCSNCPWAHELWNRVLSTRKNVIYVSHHAGYYTDAFTINESEQYLWFYNANGSTYAPASMLDRTNLSDYGAGNGNGGSSPGPVFFPGDETLVGNLVDHELASPPFVTIDIQRNYNQTNRTLTLSISSDRIEGMPVFDNMKVNVFLTEDELKGDQILGNGTTNRNYIHNHVIRKVITPTWGESVSYSSGSFTKDYTFTIPASWKTENMKAIAFVSIYDSTNPNSCMVVNAESVTIEGNVGISLIEKSNTTAYIHNNSLHIRSEAPVQSITIYNISGQEVLASTTAGNTIPVEKLPQGIYVVKVKTTQGEIVAKV